MSVWRLALAALVLAAYGVLSHLLMLHAAQAPWAVAALFGPLLLAVAATGWRRRQPLTVLACGAVVALLAWVVAHGGVRDMHRMYVLQHGAIHLALAWGFAQTLRRGSTPLITALAEGLHGSLGQTVTPAMRAYTRSLTRLWVVYFLGMVGVSALIYALAPWSWWSAYCNLLTPLAAVALFAGEHGWRRWRHPEFERVTMRAAWQAYQLSGRS